MSAAERLLPEVLGLPVDERAKLVHQLLESLESVPEVGLDDAWLAELERRSREVETRAVGLVPWETARENILNELQKRRAARTTIL